MALRHVPPNNAFYVVFFSFLKRGVEFYLFCFAFKNLNKLYLGFVEKGVVCVCDVPLAL